MKIDVKKNSPFTNFSFEAWARCGNESTTWILEYHNVVNARISVYVNVQYFSPRQHE